MKIPTGACDVIKALRASGHEAFLVGGCVRDMLLSASTAGIAVHDWDICTNAAPEEMKAAFIGHRTIDTGLKHSTITVLMDDGQYEVTAYRSGGTHSDDRRTDHTKFVGTIAEDLSFRDFTINAMAMGVNERGEAADLIDPFGGQSDLAQKRLRCVGDPNARFEEDALRILRAIRFASLLDLEIDSATHKAMLDKRELLRSISVERVMDELSKILLTEQVRKFLTVYREILAVILPELRPCFDYAQRNPWHCYSVFDHIMASVSSAPPDLAVRMTMLLHDIGKPATATTDASGIDHFYGHQKLSAEMSEDILRRYHCPTQLIHDVVELIEAHDADIMPSAKFLRRLLSKLGEAQTKRLIQVKRADTLAQSEMAKKRKLHELDASESLLEQIISQRQVFSLDGLAISGRDLLDRGIPSGPEIGVRLQKALNAVVDGTAENNADALLSIALGQNDKKTPDVSSVVGSFSALKGEQDESPSSGL